MKLLILPLIFLALAGCESIYFTQQDIMIAYKEGVKAGSSLCPKPAEEVP